MRWAAAVAGKSRAQRAVEGVERLPESIAALGVESPLQVLDFLAFVFCGDLGLFQATLQILVPMS